VVPIVIKGFSEAFNKKGILMKKTGIKLEVRFKEPMKINYDDTTEQIHNQIMDAIEQSDRFKPA